MVTLKFRVIIVWFSTEPVVVYKVEQGEVGFSDLPNPKSDDQELTTADKN